MITIYEATPADISIIRQIALNTWPNTFKDILTGEQIAYMLDMMYSSESLLEQMDKKGHRFFLVSENDRHLGFMSCEVGYKGQPITKIHKIYILPETQAKGIGKKLLHKGIELAKRHGNTILSLNVNKYNPSIGFYEKMGFRKTREEVIPIGQGYVMDDFVMDWVF